MNCIISAVIAMDCVVDKTWRSWPANGTGRPPPSWTREGPGNDFTLKPLLGRCWYIQDHTNERASCARKIRRPPTLTRPSPGWEPSSTSWPGVLPSRNQPPWAVPPNDVRGNKVDIAEDWWALCSAIVSGCLRHLLPHLHTGGMRCVVVPASLA